MRTCYTGEVSKEHLDQTVTLFGWVHRRRDHGGVIFIDLRDRAGLAQIVVDPDNIKAFSTAEDIRNEFCVRVRSEEHTSELQSLMRISYAVFCLKKKK